MLILKFYNDQVEDGHGYRLVLLAKSYTHQRNKDGTSVVGVGDEVYTVGEGQEFASLLVIHNNETVDRVVHGYPRNGGTESEQ